MIGPAPSRDDRWNPTLHAGTCVTGFPSGQASTGALSSWRTVVRMRGAPPLVGVRMRAGVGPCRAVLGGCYESKATEDWDPLGRFYGKVFSALLWSSLLKTRGCETSTWDFKIANVKSIHVDMTLVKEFWRAPA